MKKTTFLYRLIFLSFLFITGSFGLHAQEAQEENLINWGVEGSPFLAYSGYSFRIGGIFRSARHEIYAGPKLVFSKSYLPEEGAWGAQIGYRYFLVQENKWQAFVNADYQQTWYAPYAPRGVEVDGTNQIQEAHLAFGVFRDFGAHWRLGSQIGAGVYFEQNEDLVAQVTRSYSGYSNLLSLFVTYMW